MAVLSENRWVFES